MREAEECAGSTTLSDTAACYHATPFGFATSETGGKPFGVEGGCEEGVPCVPFEARLPPLPRRLPSGEPCRLPPSRLPSGLPALPSLNRRVLRRLGEPSSDPSSTFVSRVGLRLGEPDSVPYSVDLNDEPEEADISESSSSRFCSLSLTCSGRGQVGKQVYRQVGGQVGR